jgi:hypothetical protein
MIECGWCQVDDATSLDPEALAIQRASEKSDGAAIEALLD